MSEQERKVSRRDFLRMAGLGAGAGLAAPTLAGKSKPKMANECPIRRVVPSDPGG